MSNKEMLNKERLKRRLNENNIVFDIIIDKMKGKKQGESVFGGCNGNLSLTESEPTGCDHLTQ